MRWRPYLEVAGWLLLLGAVVVAGARLVETMSTRIRRLAR